MMIISVRKSRTEDHNAPKPNRYVPEIMPERHIPRLLRGRGHITRSVTKLRQHGIAGEENLARPATPRDRPDHRVPFALGISKRVLQSGEREREGWGGRRVGLVSAQLSDAGPGSRESG